MGVDAASLSTYGGIATVSLVHSLIPTHWLPFSVVGRVQKWSIHQTLSITALGAVLHVLSTSILGFTAVTMAHTVAGEEAVQVIASLLLVVLGVCYIALFLARGKLGGAHSCHSHSHLPTTSAVAAAAAKESPSHAKSGEKTGKDGGMERVAVLGLVLVPALSPCATTLPVFLAISDATLGTMAIAVAVLLGCTLLVMLTLVALSFYGASQVKFGWLEKYEKLVVGGILIAVGVLTHLFHHHDHHELEGATGADLLTAGTAFSHHH